MYSKSGHIFLWKSHYIANLERVRTKQNSGYYIAHHGWDSTHLIPLNECKLIGISGIIVL